MLPDLLEKSEVLQVCYKFVLRSACYYMNIDDSIGRQVTNELIPGIAHLRQLYPLCLDGIFPKEFLEPFCTAGYLPSHAFDCTDLLKCDMTFNTFVYK